jgi:hypothetical protein
LLNQNRQRMLGERLQRGAITFNDAAVKVI